MIFFVSIDLRNYYATLEIMKRIDDQRVPNQANLFLKLNIAHMYYICFFLYKIIFYDIILLMKRWAAMAQHLFVHNLQHNLTNVSLEQPRCSYIVDIIGESRVESNIHFYSTASSILSR